MKFNTIEKFILFSYGLRTKIKTVGFIPSETNLYNPYLASFHLNVIYYHKSVKGYVNMSALSGGYVPDYITFKGWNNVSSFTQIQNCISTIQQQDQSCSPRLVNGPDYNNKPYTSILPLDIPIEQSHCVPSPSITHKSHCGLLPSATTT